MNVQVNWWNHSMLLLFFSSVPVSALKSAREMSFCFLGFSFEPKMVLTATLSLKSSSYVSIGDTNWTWLLPTGRDSTVYIYLDKEQLRWFLMKKKYISQFVSSILIFITSHLILGKQLPTRVQIVSRLHSSTELSIDAGQHSPTTLNHFQQEFT